ncbi:MAG: hypothetical protein HY892_09120 [Deltaproteobacteria bacterium]|nr:hypothetical protein [Deltaproteobacteria bacterium]
MKRFTTMVLVLAMVLVWSGMTLAEEKKPDATLKFSEGSVAVGIGWSWGKGVLNYKGKDQAFKVKGLSVGEVGITKAEATGKVFNLKKLEDFDGLYAAAGAEGTVALGAGETALKNKKGVVIYISPLTKGVNFKLAVEGVNFTLEKK